LIWKVPQNLNSGMERVQDLNLSATLLGHAPP